MVKKSPGVILTSQFTTPSAKSFTKYIDYMSRKEALLEKGEAITTEEIVELERINNGLSNTVLSIGQVERSTDDKDDNRMTDKEKEALSILKSENYFQDTNYDYEKYISYMSRNYALENKPNRSESEEKELAVVRKKIFEVTGAHDDNPPEIEFIKSGAFSINKKIMTEKDLIDVKETIKSAQNRGSVMFQDVISFDNEFLEKEKLYDPNTNELNEKRIQDATRKMMDQMFDDEKMDSGYWFATIHRNTKHIHIHISTVENINSRKNILVKKDGFEYYEPKGKRKQKTIDNMKSVFANELVDRTVELTRISELRNTLVKDIKEIYSTEKENLQLLNELYKELPANRKYWQYGSRYLADETRNKIDVLTTSLMKDNPNYQEYLEKTTEESVYRKELFGESTRSDKDYAENQKKDIHKRLGNSLLKEMRNTSDNLERVRIVYIHNPDNKNVHQTINKAVKKENPIQKKRPYPNKNNIYQFKKALFDDYEKYRAEKDYEYLQQRIAWEQKQNEF